MLALKQLGYQLSNDSFTGVHNKIPSGCSIKITEMALHLETSPTGVGLGRNDLTPICKNPTGNFHSIWSFINSYLRYYIVSSINLQCAKPLYFAIVYAGPEIDNLGCWNYSSIAEMSHPLLSPQDPKTSLKQLMQKCYLISKSLGHSVFALKDGTTCLSSPDAEHIYQFNGISLECHSNGRGGLSTMQVYKIGKP